MDAEKMTDLRKFLNLYPIPYIKKTINFTLACLVESDEFSALPRTERKNTVNFLVNLRDVIT